LFKVKVIVKRKHEILDPQGKAVEQGAKLLGLNSVQNTRIDKFIEFNIDTNDYSIAVNEVKQYCVKLLSNPIMENFEYKIERLK